MSEDSTPQLDLTVLQSYEETLGAEYVTDFVKGCFDELHSFIDRLKAALKEDDFKEINRLSHQVKNMCSTLGFIESKKHADALERLSAKKGQGISEGIEELALTLDADVTKLKRYYSIKS